MTYSIDLPYAYNIIFSRQRVDAIHPPLKPINNSTALYNPNSALPRRHYPRPISQSPSCNLVGYNNIGTTAGFGLRTAPFSAISNAKKFNLTEMKVTGYENIEDWQAGGFDCQFTITKVDELGYTMDDTNIYDEETGFSVGYVDLYDKKNKVWQGGYWFDLMKFEDISEENDKEFTLGEGLFISSPYPIGEEVYTLITAGAVAAIDNQFNLSAGFSLIGNPMPVDVNVTDIKVSGYENIEDWQAGGFDCQLTITKVDELGYTMDDTNIYDEETGFSVGYVDLYDKKNKVWQGGYWFDLMKFEDVTPESGIEFKAGEGLFISTPYSVEGETYSITFPSPLVKHDAETAD